MSKGTREEWDALQAAARAAFDAAWEYYAHLSAKYGRGDEWRASRVEIAQRDRLNRRCDRAYNACGRWLRLHCPWEWESGTSCRYLYLAMPYAVAVSQAPVLPAEAAALGRPYQEYRPAVKRT